MDFPVGHPGSIIDCQDLANEETGQRPQSAGLAGFSRACLFEVAGQQRETSCQTSTRSQTHHLGGALGELKFPLQSLSIS